MCKHKITSSALKSGKIKGACLDVLEYENTSFEKSKKNWYHKKSKIPNQL